MFFYIDIFHFPTEVGTEGLLLLAKVQFSELVRQRLIFSKFVEHCPTFYNSSTFTFIPKIRCISAKVLSIS